MTIDDDELQLKRFLYAFAPDSRKESKCAFGPPSLLLFMRTDFICSRHFAYGINLAFFATQSNHRARFCKIPNIKAIRRRTQSYCIIYCRKTARYSRSCLVLRYCFRYSKKKIELSFKIQLLNEKQYCSKKVKKRLKNILFLKISLLTKEDIIKYKVEQKIARLLCLIYIV